MIHEFVIDLGTSPVTEDRETAVALAEKLARQQPTAASSHALLGSAYDSLWLRTKKKADADKAILEYETFLNIAPANDPFRRGAQQLLTFLKHDR